MGSRPRRQDVLLARPGRPWLALLALVLLPAVCPAQGVRIDTHVPSEQEGLDLLRAVCPNDLQSKPSASGGVEFSCKTCPAFTVFPGKGGPFTMLKVIYGNFTSPSSFEAFVGFAGCAPPPGAGGSVLLKKSPSGWSMSQFEPGRFAWDCRRYPLRNRHQILLCADGWTWQGFQETEFFMLDFAIPGEDHAQQLVQLVADNAGACPEIRKKISIDRTELRDLNYDGWPDLSVFLSAGKAATPEDRRKNCTEGPPPPMRAYRLDFLFNGKLFLTAPWSAETKKLLEDF
jgi:hypothetical protein